MILLVVLVAVALVAVSHTTPFPFLLEYLGPDRSVWHMPASDGQLRIYLTYGDGPNPEATPTLLAARETVGHRPR